MKKLLLAVTLLASIAGFAQVQAQERSTAPHGAKVMILSPKNGAKVKSPVTVKFGIEGMTLAPAGTPTEHAGHHHLFVDTDLPSDMTKPIPVVEGKVIHFGKGQTETTLDLPPGKHTLQLLLGDHLHIPHNPPVKSKKITITVE